MTDLTYTPPKTIEWTGDVCRLLDQTKLPGEETYLDIADETAMWGAIKRLSVRGAPAIGVAAAYGLYLGARNRQPQTRQDAIAATREVADYLATSRPTAVNLFWALDQCRKVAEERPAEASASDVLDALLKAAKAIHADDRERCAAIARHGAPLLSGKAGVLTHCNAGALATAGVGTALGVIIEGALRENAAMTVYVDETRPLLQGARLTAWELKNAGVAHRLIADNMAATAMQRGLVQAVVTGADRIASNGDSANKIGTMPLAIVARHFNVPFYIAAPLSTVDLSLGTGADIPIEERDGEEITSIRGQQVAPLGTSTFNPAFDVVPASLIEAIVTEVGIVRKPFSINLRKAFEVDFRGGETLA
ncbi:MAG: S-methyl-5-thioribose-1-phosphate isomerase [Sumerlaeia bacterium]